MGLTFGLVIPSWDKEAAEITVANLVAGEARVNQVLIAGASRTENRWGAVEAMGK